MPYYIIRVQTTDDQTIPIGVGFKEGHFLDRFEECKTVASAVQDDLDNIDYVDMEILG